MKLFSPFVLILPLLGGCVAFNIGRPESVKTFEYKAETVSLGEEPRKALSAEPAVRQDPPKTAADTGLVFVGLEGRVRRTDKWGDIYKNVDLLRQKRLSFGFSPGHAEDHDSVASQYYNRRLGYSSHQTRTTIYKGNGTLDLSVLVAPYIMTPYALLVSPFYGAWECKGHAVCPTEWPTGKTREPITMSDWVHSDLYADFERYMSVRLGYASFGSASEHMALFGFHRFVKYIWGTPVESRMVDRTTTAEEDAFGRGPFSIELEVPDIGFREKAVVPSGAREAAFTLPFADADRNANATVRFSAIASRTAEPADDATRALLASVRGRDCAVKVRLRSPPPGLASVAQTNPGTAGVVTQVVARVAPAIPYRISKTQSADGSSAWRVTILDDAKTGLEIAALVRPKILAELRDGYLASHPSAKAESVRAAAGYETADGGKMLVFTGAAFELRPVVDGWRYDERSRRGAIRLQAPEDVSTDLLRRWMKENIAEIVKDKNVTLSAGSAAPTDARFLLLSESLENGILTVEFEAIQ